MKTPRLNEHRGAGRIRGGKLTVRRWNEFLEAAKQFPEGEVVLTMTTWKKRRSLDANSLYWVGFITPVSEATGEEPQAVHAYFKRLFLPRQRIVLTDRNGEVLDDVEVEALTTTNLTVMEFSEYLRQIAGWALEKLGLVLKSNRGEQSQQRAA